MQANLRQEADQKAGQIRVEIGEYCPLGKMSDLALVMGIKPKRGVTRATPLGTIIFRTDNVPPLDTVQRWFDMDKEVKEMRKREAELGWFVCDVGTTIGNRHYMERGEELDRMGLLEPEEKAFLQQLQKFWGQHPSAKSGVVKEDGSIEPYPPGWEKII